LVESVPLCHSVCYEFVINDSEGDGMCDTNGCGSFEIVVKEEVVLSGGDLNILSVHKLSFCLDGSGNVQPQSGVNTGSGSSVIDVVIDFYNDYYPEDISWTISDTTSNSNIYGEESNYDADELRGKLVIKSVTLWNNKCYQFVIQDSVGDGLCSNDFGCGEYGIIVKDDYIFEDGNFGNSDTVSLCLDDSGNFVEPLSECGDDSDFGWKNKAKKNCEWVARKKQKGKKLCGKKGKYRGESKKIRDYCQETCGQC